MPLKIKSLIVPLAFLVFAVQPLRLLGSDNTRVISFGFCGDFFQFSFNDSLFVDFTDDISEASIEAFYKKTTEKNFATVINALTGYKEKYNPDDWMFYQLIRKTAQQLSPKEKNYPRYTLYKWLFLTLSGYDAIIRIAENKILFYVRSDEYIYNIPLYMKAGKQYVCLNYHDYGSNIDFQKNLFTETAIDVPGAQKAFSYKITRMPDFRPESYSTKELAFDYNETPYRTEKGDKKEK